MYDVTNQLKYSFGISWRILFDCKRKSQINTYFISLLLVSITCFVKYFGEGTMDVVMHNFISPSLIQNLMLTKYK
jgi:hypothetical protein